MLRELKRAAYAFVRERQSSLQLAGDAGVRHALAVEIAQTRFVFERIHLRNAPLHEEEDAVFCFAPMHLEPLPKGIARHRWNLSQQIISAQVIGQQPAEPECAKAIPCPVEEISSALEGVVNGGISPHRQIRWR